MEKELERLVRQKFARAKALEAEHKDDVTSELNRLFIDEQVRIKAAMFDASGQWLDVFYQSVAQAIRDVAKEKNPQSNLGIWMVGLLALSYVALLGLTIFVRGNHNVQEGKEFLEGYVLAFMIGSPTLLISFGLVIFMLWRHRS